MSEPRSEPPSADRVAIGELSREYAAAADMLDGPRFASVFSSEGALWVPDRSGGTGPVLAARGRAALTRIPAGLARYHATRHLLTGAEIIVDGHEATGTVSCSAHHVVSHAIGGDPRSAPQEARLTHPGSDLIWHIRYEDTYRRTDQGWRITCRFLHLDDVEEVPLDEIGPPRPGPGGAE